ncbi:MAG: hypothetical protein ACR2H4_05820, partial [Pyrinomonadaceae bacterium]
PRFLQTLPHDNALALCYPSPPSGWKGTFTLKSSNMLGTRYYIPAPLALKNQTIPQLQLVALPI